MMSLQIQKRWLLSNTFSSLPELPLDFSRPSTLLLEEDQSCWLANINRDFALGLFLQFHTLVYY